MTRAAADLFHILLPETEQAEGDVLAGRIREACALSAALAPGDAFGKGGLQFEAAEWAGGTGWTGWPGWPGRAIGPAHVDPGCAAKGAEVH